MKRPILLLTCFLLAAVHGNAQWAGASIDSVTNDSERDEVYKNSFACDELNRLHLVYMQANSAGGWNIFYTMRDPSTDWSAPDTVSSEPGFNAVLGIHKPTGEPYVVYESADTNDHDIIFCEKAGGTWTCIPVMNNIEEDAFPSIAVDSSNFVHIAWVGQDSTGEYKINYATNLGGNWVIQKIDTSMLGQFGSGAAPSIAVDLAGRAHIAYRGGDFGTYRIHHAYNDSAGGTEWNVDVVMTPNAEDLSSAIAVDIDTTVHLLVSGNDGFGFPTKAYYLTKDFSSLAFSTPVPVAAGFSASVADLYVDSQNTAYAVLNEISANLYTGNVIFADENNWAGSMLLGTMDVYGGDLLIDETGNGYFAGFQGNTFQDQEIIVYGVLPVTGIEMQVRNEMYSLAQDRTSIRLRLLENYNGMISLTDLRGRKMNTVEGSFLAGEQVVIPTEGRPAGIYFIHLDGEENEYIEKVAISN